MSADALLSRLDGLKRTGKGRWIAKCPAHEDRRPSLSIRELDDGRVLMHCFAGCAAGDVLSAAGLDFDALYPERAADHRVSREHQPFDARSTLRALPTELAIIVIYASDVRAQREVSDGDHQRFLLAVERVTQAATLAGP